MIDFRSSLLGKKTGPGVVFQSKKGGRGFLGKKRGIKIVADLNKNAFIPNTASPPFHTPSHPPPRRRA